MSQATPAEAFSPRADGQGGRGSSVVRVLHAAVPGRLRVHLTELPRHAGHPRALEEVLEGVPGVERAQIRGRTRNALLEFDPRIAHAEITKHLHDALTAIPWAEFARAHMPPPPPSNAIRAGVEAAPPPAPRQGPAWHQLTGADAEKELASCARNGLGAEEAAARLRQFGPNRVDESTARPQIAILAEQFEGLPVLMLAGSAVLSLATGAVLEAAVTVGVLFVNAGIGFSTENRAERTIRGMTRPQPHTVRIRRDGRNLEIQNDGIVPGDLLVLTPGALVAADARVLEAQALATNEALLTGESEVIEKVPDPLLPENLPLADRRNMVYSGSYIAKGRGLALVVATGPATEIGAIETAARRATPPQTPLERDLARTGRDLALGSLAICAGVVGIGLLEGRPMAAMLKSAVALAVAAVPEGLPAVATTTLALGLGRMARRDVIIRRLKAIEALGSMQVLALDKTGTLTQNRMAVGAIRLPAREVELDGGGERTDFDLQNLLLLMSLNSEVRLAETAEGPELGGTATEAALIRFALDRGMAVERVRAANPRLSLRDRDEEHRYVLTLHGKENGKPDLVTVKGDPRQLLSLCRQALVNGKTIPLSDALRTDILSTNESYAARALRVLGFAYARGPALSSGAMPELTFAGLVGLRDPLRPGAKALVKTLHTAGVRPVMITGDQATTAFAVAEELGIAENEPLQILDAEDLAEIDPELLAGLAQRVHVFARVPPARKLEIVAALQRAGYVVGMTGDGFNDAPALKAADVAIALGEESASAARNIADVVLTRSELEVIGDAIREGRTILSNVRKSVHFMISTNLSEILVVLIETLNTADEIESPMELFWINLVTDVLPGLGLALEPAERNVMRTPPHPPGEPILKTSDLVQSAEEAAVLGATTLAAHAYGLARYGPGAQTRSITFLSLVGGQLLHALACRQDRVVSLGGQTLVGNRPLTGALAVSMGLQVLPLFWPPLGRLIGIARPGALDLGVASMAALSSFAINETIIGIRTEAGRHRIRHTPNQAA